MTVTKQQQLEWMAKNLLCWPGQLLVRCVKSSVIHMSKELIGKPADAFIGHAITLGEWQQERDKMQNQPVQPEQDNSWYERGEMPPVGCECEIMHRFWIEPNKVKISAITKEYVIVVGGQNEQHYYLRDITFRPLSPLRTEREKAIEELNALVGDIEKYPTWRDAISGIIDAGYRKEQPK